MTLKAGVRVISETRSKTLPDIMKGTWQWVTLPVGEDSRFVLLLPESTPNPLLPQRLPGLAAVSIGHTITVR